MSKSLFSCRGDCFLLSSLPLEFPDEFEHGGLLALSHGQVIHDDAELKLVSVKNWPLNDCWNNKISTWLGLLCSSQRDQHCNAGQVCPLGLGILTLMREADGVDAVL